MNSLAASAAERLAHYTELAVQFREWAKSEADAEARAGLLDMAFQYERLTNEVKARIDAILRSGASRPVGLPQLVWAVREPRAELFGLLMVGELHMDHRVIGSIVGVAEHGEIEPVMIEPLAHRAEQVGETSRATRMLIGYIGHPLFAIWRERVVSLSRRSPEAEAGDASSIGPASPWRNNTAGEFQCNSH